MRCFNIRVWITKSVTVLLAVTLFACTRESDQADQIQSEAVDPRFSTASAFIEHFNTLTTADTIKCSQLSPLIHPETDFQRTWSDSLGLVARAESFHDAVLERFGASVDPKNQLAIQIHLGQASLISENGNRAEAAVVKTSQDSIGKMMLVKVGDRWWISGYTWEYAMSQSKKDELPKRALTFQVEAEIDPPLLNRLNRGEFGNIDQVRAAHRAALLEYFRQHPDLYERITGHAFREP